MNPPVPTHGFLHYIKETLRQAWPVLVSAWASMAFGVMDTAMAGHAGAAQLQAMALAVSIYISVFIGLMGVIHALIPIIGQHYGGKRLLEVGRAWGQGVWLALVLSVLGAVPMLFPDLWLTLSGDIEPAVRDGVTWYLRALILALPAALVFRAIYALSTAVSRPKIVMSINLACIGVKALFNWILIFGKFGVPAMGAAGAGLSTAITSWVSLAAGLWIIRHDKFFRQFQPRLDRPRWADQKELLRLGIPMGGSYFVEVCAFTFMALLIAREGMYATGGHQITANLMAVCYMLPMSIGIASASLTAQAIGARDMVRARQTGLAGLVITLGGAMLTILLVMGGQPLILSAYTGDLKVAAMAAALLQILPYFHVCDAMQCINSYLLRAYKIAVVPLLMQTLALTGIGLIGGWLLGFGPLAGALQPMLQLIMPGAPIGAASMWMMAAIGLGLAAVLQNLWYWRVVRQYRRENAA